MATREEIFVLLRSNDYKKVREGLYKAKLYDSELYDYCMRLFELCGYSIKVFIWAMDFQRGILTNNLKDEYSKIVEAEDLEDINKFLGLEIDVLIITINDRHDFKQLRVNYHNGKKPVESN